MDKRWTKKELADLKKNASNQSIDKLARTFKTAQSTIRNKIVELGLESQENTVADEEAAVDDFARGLKLLHSEDWAQAAKVFESVIVASDSIHLADRARQSLAICTNRLDDGADSGEPYLQAVFEKNQGNLKQALEICQEHGNPDEEPFAYLMASIQALDGAEDEALELLETAIRLDPKNRVHAFHDSDFQALHGREQFSQLVQAP